MQKKKEEPQEAATTAKPPQRHKILVAEDNTVVRKGLNNFLTKWGYEPVEADNGDIAWDTLETDPAITMAILDWNIPGLSGMQVCQRIRMRTEGQYVYTIIFSARSSIEEQVLALEGGADDYLTKPTKPSLLRARLGVGLRIMNLLAASKAGSLK
ncbi:MAG: two-component system response regulator [Deltaproteobacteria bacterium RIFOXYD12_FULL_55_16]|nr:MAG: two-component system response regulator [Deltaproteobacteria bacterium RIFOXYD12_FULL_55_16]